MQRKSASKRSKTESLLERYYRIGTEALADQPRDGAYHGDQTARLAKEYGVSGDDVRKARTFASVYSKAEFQRLLNLSLHWAHVRQLVSVTDKALRAKLEKAIVENGWSVRDLIGQIKQLYGRRQGGGRPAKDIESAETATTKMAEVTRLWLSAYKQAIDRIAEADHKTTPRMLEYLRHTYEDIEELKIAANNVSISLKRWHKNAAKKVK